MVFLMTPFWHTTANPLLTAVVSSVERGPRTAIRLTVLSDDHFCLRPSVYTGFSKIGGFVDMKLSFAGGRSGPWLGTAAGQ
jgi:hypothetical protein